jgi:ADP-heptose:LPS heptosyltransferase
MNINIKNIVVIIPHRGIGDVIYHLPLLKTLYKNYNTKITVISNHENKSKNILKKEDFLKKIIYFNFNRTNLFNYILRFIKLKRIINNLNAEILILTDPSKRLVIPIFFCKAKKKIYVGIKSFKEFLLKKKNFRSIPLANHLIDLIKSLKFKNPEYSFMLNNYCNEKKFNYSHTLNKPYIFFSLDSHHNQNNWNLSGFKKIIDKIKNTTVFINTSPNNLNFFRKDLNRFFYKSNIIITSKFSITKLIKIISSCKIIIGNESGPICIGASLNKKVISIYTKKTTKPESKIISKKIKYFNATKLNENKIVNNIYKIILKNISK